MSLFEGGFGNYLGEGLFSDVSIKLGDSVYKLHKIILSRGSKYFEALFRNSFKDSNEKEIEIKFEDPDSRFREVVNFIYTGKVALTRENVLGILSMADKVQVVDLVWKCKSYLAELLDEDNVFQLCIAADTFALRKIEERCLATIADMFSELSETNSVSETFCLLSVEQMCSLLSRQLIHAKSELQILNVLLEYTAHKRGLAPDEISSLYKHIRFENFTPEEIDETRKTTAVPKDLLLEGLVKKVRGSSSNKHSASPETRFTCTALLEWEVLDFPNIRQRYIKSPVFSDCRGRSWELLIYPKNGNQSSYMSVYIYGVNDDETDEEIQARKSIFTMKIYSHRSEFPDITFQSSPHQFTRDDNNWGWADFARYSLVKNSLLGKDNSLRIRCAVATDDGAA